MSYRFAAAAESLRTWRNCSEPEHILLHSWDNLAWNSPSLIGMVTSQQKLDLHCKYVQGNYSESTLKNCNFENYSFLLLTIIHCVFYMLKIVILALFSM